jgi:hypothetical protein
MKKVLFSIAIVAAGLLVASCGNKSGKNTEGADSASVTDQLPEGFVHYEGGLYSFDCPQALSNSGTNDTIYLCNAPDRNASLYVHWAIDQKTVDDGLQKMADRMLRMNSDQEIVQQPTIEGNLLTFRLKDTDKGRTVAHFYLMGEGGKILYGNMTYEAEAEGLYAPTFEPFVKSLVLK